MSVQALWSLFLAHPGQLLNGLALFFAMAGAWLLLATRMREQRAVARLLASNEMDELAYAMDEPTVRLNRFFYRFGHGCLVVALIVSWASTQL
ncbi:MAG TPA: hypothetical protein VJ047_02985 [Pseudomonas sp.]|nr:hypothetical protein [Pseudomonas sp.]